MRHHFSSRAASAKRSPIRELLKLTEQPDIISLGGGLPAPETFPHLELAKIAEQLLREEGHNVLQYGTSEGSRTLRTEVAKWLGTQDVHVSIHELLVTTASQQGLDLLCKAFFDPGDVVFCGLPTYLGAVQAFSLFQVTKIGVPLEDDGMDIDELEARIVTARREGKKMKGIYTIPDFQNPTGITMSLEKRRQLLEVARAYDLLIFEDNPYGHLRFAGEPLPSIFSMDEEGRTIMLLTFSKVLSAGLRLAVMVARGDLMEVLVRVKQPTDLCTSKLTQMLAARYMQKVGLDRHLADIRPIYREKKEAMIAALEKHMPDEEGLRWTNPDGGLFIWVWLPEGIDAEEMLPRAIANKVAYVPGASSYVDGDGHNTMRLSFSSCTLDQIDEAIRRLAHVVTETIAARKVTTGS